MRYFVWSKVQVESGLSLPQILFLKETERLAGDGIFWWGVGTALDREALREAAEKSAGALPVLFSLMISRPKPSDARPKGIYVWTEWEAEGRRHELPTHVLEFSRAHGRESHYALVCRSPVPLALVSHPFNSTSCRNYPSGNPLGSSQATALLQGDLDGEQHSVGSYHFGFRATLVEPWLVKLANPRTLAETDMQLFNGWKAEWRSFASQLKGSGSR